MNLLSRYLFKRVLFASLAGVGLFVFILIAGNAIRDIAELLAARQITLALFLELLALLIPYAVSYSMPLGVLLGTLIIMGRLSANHEITVMRAAGISLWRLAMPVMFVACICSMLAFYINAFYAPQARASYKGILNDLVRTDPLRFIVPKTFIHDFPGYVIYVSEKDADQLKRFWIWELDEENRAVRLLRAREGRFFYDEATDSLQLTLKEGFTELRDEDEPDNLSRVQPILNFRDASIRLPLSGILGTASRTRDISQLNLAALLQRREMLERQAAQAETAEQRSALLGEKIRAQYHANRNIAMAFSIIALAMIGIPLGLQVGRKETYANIAIALAIALVYYLTMVFIDWTEYRPDLRPDILVWLPNSIYQSTGFIMLFRASKM